MDTWFRRAEGLTLVLDLCSGHRELRAHRESGDQVSTLTPGDMTLLGRLSSWATAGELSVPEDNLRRLVSMDAAFFCSWRPTRQLTGEPLAVLSGPVRLASNVFVKLLLCREGRVDHVPFMPRRGMLAGAALWGASFSVFEHGKKTFSLRVGCCAAHGRVVRDLVPRLDGRVSAETLRLDPATAPVLEALNTLGLLEVPPARPPLPSTSHATWLGHAAVLMEMAGTRVLVDPLFHPRSIPGRDGQILPPDPRDVGPVDAVLITHGDNDHFNAQALAWIPPATPILIPRTVEKKPYQVDLEGVLALLGFSNVRTMTWWETDPLGALQVTCTPFHGEDWGLTLPSCTWLLSGGGHTVYLSADSVFHEETCRRIAASHTVDLAFLGVTGNAETHLMPPGFGYGDFYALWIPPGKRNQWVELCAGPAESARAAVLLKARHAFGYAAGGAAFMPVAYSDRGTHAELADHLAKGGHAGVPVDLPLARPWKLP